MQNTIIFAAAFLVGLLWFRIIYLLVPGYFNKPFTRTKTKLAVHHLHFGIIFVLIAALILLADTANYFVFIFLGLGLGQIFDLFIPSLLIKRDRSAELKLYKATFPHTLIVAAAILAAAFFLAYLFNTGL
ncbi:hypothetical protein JW911_03465 [Candidatus Peregrinibacteria bacterium]|nr:hypothetical protein [Candidatus Peregrinibacteria bacterium]